MSSSKTMSSGPLTSQWIDRRRLYIRIKRAMDLAIASLALVLLSPLMLVIAILIKLDSPGPVLFAQERVGARLTRAKDEFAWDIAHFHMLKFRSMFHNADQSLHEAHVQAFVQGKLTTGGESGSQFKLIRDPRVTRVGRILRRTSLDELPQLINVVRGEMSLVGPRPVPTYEAAHYEGWHKERLSALPGITGLWQVMGRCDLPFEEMVRLDIDYIQSQSIWLDTKILLLTIPAVLNGRGAG
jgi:lipopolysaccharide/colanic/teichoic acid biosynthesis glycosyltransferase